MNKKLKQAIVNFIIENEKEFQLTNRTAEEFRPYIYDNKGEYLIGGEEVLNFIRDAEKLLTH